MNRTTKYLLAFAAMAYLVALASVAYGAPTDPTTVLGALSTLFPNLLSGTDPSAGAVLAFGPLVRGLQAKHADTVAHLKAIVDAAEAEGRDLTAEELKVFDAHKAEAASLKARIARAQETELAEAGIAAQPGAAPAGRGGVTIPARARISVEENVEADPQRGFTSFGEFAQAVRGATLATRMGAQMDRRLAPLAPMGPMGPMGAAPPTFGGEGSGADGGLLVPPGFSKNIFTLSLEEDALLPLTDDLPIDGNNMLLPKDETTPWGTNGIRAYWQAEGTVGTATKPVISAMDLRLKKLLALVPVSDELLQDTSALSAYLPTKVALSIRWKTNEAILFGSGAGLPLGALSGGSLVTVTKDTGQATLTLTATNLANMMARLPPGSYPRAVWIINNDVLPALFTMTLGNYPIYLPGGANVGGMQVNPYGLLLGRPIVVSQHAKSFSAQGDVLLVDLSYYQAITKAEGIQTATSMHLYFDADAMAFRTTFRMDGQPKLAAPISPANGTKTLSPFVQLGAR